jgi:recombination protein RecR
VYHPPHHTPTMIDHLITSVAKLPGLGGRSSRRIVLHLLRKKTSVLEPLIAQLEQVAAGVQSCEKCRTLDVINPCSICRDGSRDKQTLCVVEDVADLWAIERSRLYRGQYHVLGGVLSAIDGIGPEQLGIAHLVKRTGTEDIHEVILATNATADGQTTSHYITDALEGFPIRITRLAQGIPMGGELDYLDDGTLGAALQARLTV